ncbi:MAG: HAMP domain-containing protein [Candidatus Riflebacteria bacterium]|nr:HAMP domain-containing protein [Candidatus Riflebacteria bacterium]
MIRLSMALRFKLAGVFTIVLVFFFGLFSLYQLHAVNEEIQTSLSADLRLLHVVAQARGQFARVRGLVLDGLRMLPANRLADALPELEKLRQLVKTVDSFEMTREVASRALLLTQLDLYREEILAVGLLASRTPTVPPDPTGHAQSPAPPHALPAATFADQGWLVDLLTSQEEIADSLRTLEHGELLLLAADQQQIGRLTKALQTRMAILAILTLAGSIGLSFFFSQQIRLPIRRIRDLISAIRDGNYEVTVRTGSNDELGQIFEALAHMVQHIAIRDRLKIEKILQEKNRFAALANHLDAPIMLLNRERKIAFANNPFMEFFRLTWDDVYEIDLHLAALPQELKARIERAIKTQEWPEDEPLDAIGENYAYEMHLTFVPVNDEKGQLASLVAILGRLRPPPAA